MATARAQLLRWGNSLALRVPKHMAEAANLREGDELILETEHEGAIAVKAVEHPESLQSLLAKITPENCYREEDWGKPTGKELW